MYILIDRERMALIHKHPNPNVLCDLAWIECHQAPYSIFPFDDANELRSYTDMELTTLYRNITGVDHNLTRPQLMQVLFDLIDRIPESDVNPFEADRQAALIPEGDERRWLYVKGATRPAQKADLFEPGCKQAKRSEEEESRAKAGKLPALQRKAAAPAPRTERDRPQANAQQRAPAPSGPKRGTAKAIIWAVADKMWEDAGKPTDKAEVLALRKEIMNALEKEESIKRSSSSSELGNWHKERAPY